jgi:pimeloyl-ACP methyl ester carboxylesterase
MAIASVRGVDINYQVLGPRGPWVALQPGGRRALGGVKSLAEKLAEAGNRVLIYDRRNCGASGVAFEGDGENEVWAEDLRELLMQLDATPAFIGGSSSGCRLALLMALRHAQAVRGLFCGGSPAGIMRPSGSPRITTVNISTWPRGAAWRRCATASTSPKLSPPTRQTARA